MNSRYENVDAFRADDVLSALGEVYALDDVQEIVDRICQHVSQISSFRTVLLSLYFGEDIYIGLVGGDEAMRERFLESARRSTGERRARRRDAIWRSHRIEGTDICWLPEGSTIPLSVSFTPSEDVPGQEWRPEDRLMIFVRGMDDEVRGVLSLDRPVDGRRIDPDDLGRLAVVDRYMKMMGVLIHNKHLAAKLRESEERYAAVVEQGHDGILIARGGQVLFANRRIGEMAGLDPQALVGRPVESLLVQEQASLPGEIEARLLGDAGRSVDVALRESTIRFGGASARLLAVADITERKRVHAQLVRAQKMESVGTLASGIAHDFNNLLGGILGYASLLKVCLAGDENASRYVDSIERAADRAADVTRQLLGIVRDEQVRVQPFPVAHVLGEVASLLEETLDPSIRITVRCAGDLPPVLGDESQIHQVLLNICLNARDAMPHGGSLELRADRAGDESVRIVVCDSGAGMDPEILAKVFDPFFTTKAAASGSGLGLYMAYRIVERHGGTVDITSRPGAGTSVEICLPARVGPAPAEPPSQAGDTVDGAGIILLVDDEQLMRDVSLEMLRGLGYEVVTACDGREAVEEVRRAPGLFHCVVLDIAMPVMNGWEAASAIRDLEPALPILFSSGHDVDAALGDTHGFQAARCLKKPYRLDDLRVALDSVMRSRVPPA